MDELLIKFDGAVTSTIPSDNTFWIATLEKVIRCFL
jgi:hypothetical protein